MVRSNAALLRLPVMSSRLRSDMALKIRPRAVEAIAEVIRGGSGALETGGALFGSDSAEVIEHATTPGPKAIHGPANFSRDREHTKAESSRLYRLDRSRWIGEWHTHPATELIPSEVDLATYVRHLTDPELRFERFLALICSASAPIQVAAWRIRIVSGRVTVDSPRLEVIHPS